ncbi:MAG: tRNA pseudouridine(55) synthase TruB [Thermoanaerobacterales bacterium]|nr:tRNA pseudouridine(55) synthase TruB [Thermoanaerobacterales bacterium]
MSGIINVLKPPGMTSHDVVSWVRRTINVRKVGHGGTLDPYAAGVLPIFIGKATKAVRFFESDDKEYIAELLLGVTTKTGDAQGAVTSRKNFNVDETVLKKTLVNFVGRIKQIPPMYSAVHHKGKRLYELARRGITVERNPRIVEIKSIELLHLQNCRAILKVSCSKGTYIRTLCEDIGKHIGCGACLSSLVRTRSGLFLISNSFTIEEISVLVEDGTIHRSIIHVDDALKHFPKVKVGLSAEMFISKGKYICQGNIDLLKKLTCSDIVRIYDNSNIFIGIGEIRKKQDGNIYVSLIKSLR